MSKYDKKPEVLISKHIKFKQSKIIEAENIHHNFSEFVRDALDEKIIKEQKILDGNSSGTGSNAAEHYG